MVVVPVLYPFFFHDESQLFKHYRVNLLVISAISLFNINDPLPVCGIMPIRVVNIMNILLKSNYY